MDWLIANAPAFMQDFLVDFEAQLTMWALIGAIGQMAFFSRMLVQWVTSERRQESVVPMMFWWLSLIGGAILLSYGIHKRDPVIIMGQSFGFVVYVRNLILIYRKRSADREAAKQGP